MLCCIGVLLLLSCVNVQLFTCLFCLTLCRVAVFGWQPHFNRVWTRICSVFCSVVLLVYCVVVLLC